MPDPLGLVYVPGASHASDPRLSVSLGTVCLFTVSSFDSQV